MHAPTAIDLRVPGQGTVSLRPENFLARGGEASVYAMGNRVFKVWHDPAACPEPARLSALQSLHHPAAVLPIGVLLDGESHLRGTVQPRVPDAEPWARLCTPAYQQRHSLSPRELARLVAELRDAVAALHAQGVLLADLSDTNVLVTRAGRVHLIDAEAWGVGPFAPRALTPTIADPTCSPYALTTHSDWFSFAVLAFQLLLGTHPYAGIHPTVKGVLPRMKAGLSVLDATVTAPQSARPLSTLAPDWQHWFTALFTTTHRSPPPHTVQPPKRPRPVPTKGLRTQPVAALDGEARGWACAHGHWATWTDQSLWADGVCVGARRPDLVGMAITPSGAPVMVRLHDRRLRLQLIDGTEVPLLLHADRAEITHDGRVVALSGDRLVEVTLHSGARTLASARTVGTVLPHATHLAPGAAVQDVHGHAWLTLFSAPGRALQHRVPKLDGLRHATVLASGNAAAAHTTQRAFWLRAGAHHIDVEDLSAPPRSMVQHNGLTVIHTQDDALLLAPSAPGSTARRRVPVTLTGVLVPGLDGIWVLEGDRVLRASLS